ncbi:glycosyltransferase family 4 protein [Chitinophaga sp.]|uniref:glycosyltransferase family 4 protein n=1 Tax=Chitinophaga sp. TaxID=1869181 RepID=UPI0031D64002
MKKIIAVHLTNDRSGNTLIFRESLEALAGKGMDIHLITNGNSHTPGYLTDLSDIQYHYINYIERGNKMRLFFSFLLAQMSIFFKVLLLSKKGDKVYINTLQPFGAAWASRLKGAQITYHIHETAIQHAAFRKPMLKSAQLLAHQIVYASRFVQSQFEFRNAEKRVIHSCLPSTFIQEAVLHAKHGTRKTILMVAKLEEESGVEELMELAQTMPKAQFELVIEGTYKEIGDYFKGVMVPNNVMIYDAQQNLHPFYQRAAVVVNLSHAAYYQETFDVSILQAMSYGRPVIVPLAGGANELVAHGWNGYRISGHYIEQVRKHIEQLMNNKPLYADMSCAAQLVASQFKPTQFRQQVEDVFMEGTCYTPTKKQEVAEVLLYPAALQEYLNTALN